MSHPDFDPPALDAGARPEFTDPDGCAEWLRELPLVNVAPSHGRLLGQLEELNGYDMPPAERLGVLEQLRAPAAFLQTELTRKFSNRAVPLSRPEREIFHAVVALWDALSLGYRHCLQAAAGGAHALDRSIALACQRALWCAAARLSSHYQAYQEFDADDWKLLHRVYAFAEERGVARDEIAHPERDIRTSCAETYVQALLLNLANPNEQSPRQLALVTRWLEHWAGKVSLARAPAADSSAAPLTVDLAALAGAAHAAAAAGESVRFLHMDELSRSIRKRIGRLREGDSPAALGLGDEVAPSMAENLLVMLYRQWCEDHQSREQSRRSASGTAQLCTGLAAMHYYVSGRPFRQPGEAKELTKTQREEIATFGRIATRQDDDYSLLHGFALEVWQIRDESLSGLRLERLDPAANSRLYPGQLVAVRPADARNFLLGSLRWLSVTQNLELRAGVRVIPGVPAGVAVRGTGVHAAAEKFSPALMLPAVAALQSPDSLVLPAGWFKPRRVIELFGEQARAVALLAVIDRGADFECVTFEPV